jgi:CyaY protein
MAMTESDFLSLADDTLLKLETAVERLADHLDIDVDIERQAYVLTLNFGQFGKIIVNAQAPMMEMWVAATSGGFHFARQNNTWVNTRTGQMWTEALNAIVSQQLRQTVLLQGIQ